MGYMKYGIGLLVSLSLIAVGCETGTSPSKPPLENPAPVESVNKEPNEPSGNKDAEKKFTVDALNAEDISRGKFTGMEFQVGSPFDDIVERWGQPVEKGYLRGGSYYLYTHDDYDVYYFDPQTSKTVQHIQVNPKATIRLDDIRKQLGKPDNDELDEMLEGNWVLVYQYDHFTLFVSGKTEARNSEVQYLFLKRNE